MTQRSQLIVWGIAVALAMAVALPVLDHIGRIELAIPTVAAALTISAVVKVNWEFHERLWFWVTMAAIAGLHVLLILCIPWHKGWIPAPVTLGFCIVDAAIILGILNLIGRLFEGGARTSAP
jgi:hypothetical protein